MKATKLAAALFSLSCAVQAAPITFDFEDPTEHIWVPTPGLVNVLGGSLDDARTLIIDGFRFVPGARMNLNGPSPNYESTWLGFDGAPHIQGGDGATVRFEHLGGELFSLLGFDPLSLGGPAHWTVTSSNGGSYTNNPSLRPPGAFNLPPVTLTGAEWTDVMWLRFEEPQSSGGSDGFDNLRIDFAGATTVPEPPTWLLMVLPIAGLLVRWKSEKSYR